MHFVEIPGIFVFNEIYQLKILIIPHHTLIEKRENLFLQYNVDFCETVDDCYMCCLFYYE